METREIVEADFPACVDIFNEAWNDLHRRYGYEDEVSDDDSWLLKPFAHFLRTDRSGSRIALDNAGPVAFGWSVRRDHLWYLAFLFVRPRTQGQGVGTRLLQELLPDQDDEARACEVESFQSVATAMYVSAGMTPCAIRYFLAGPARPGHTSLRDSGLLSAQMSRDDFPEIDALDERVLGFRRPLDHPWWLGPMTGLVYRRGENLVGYAYVDDGWIAPALAVDEETLADIVADIVRSADDPSSVKTSIWGTSGTLFRSLLDAGWRVEESKYAFIYLSSTGPLPGSYISHTGWLP